MTSKTSKKGTATLKLVAAREGVSDFGRLCDKDELFIDDAPLNATTETVAREEVWNRPGRICRMKGFCYIGYLEDLLETDYF